MSYLLRNKRERRGYRGAVVAVLIVIGLLYALESYSPFFGSVLRSVGRPVWVARESVLDTFSERMELLRSKRELVSENEILKKELASSREKLVQYEALRLELDRISRTGEEEDGVIRARVLVRPPQTIYDSFILDVGATDGVKVGDLVYVSDSILIGEITAVSSRTAEARLFSSGGQQTSVKFPSGTEFTAYGKGGGTYELKVPRDVVVKEGDPLTRPGKDFWMYGSVGTIASADADSFKRIMFRIPVNLHELSYVKVVSGSSVADEERVR